MEALFTRGISLASSIQNIKASLSKPGRSHIQSHRRQVYIKETNTPLPESFKITHEETNYRIYLSTDSTLCFTCKQAGHVAKICPQNILNSSTQNAEMQSAVSQPHGTPKEIHSSFSPTPTPSVPILDTRTIPVHSPSAKRQNTRSLSTSSSPSTLTDEASLNFEPKIKKPSAKKMKKTTTKASTLDEVKTQMEPLEKFINGKTDTYPLSHEKLIKFLFCTYNKSNIPEIALDFTENTAALISMLSDIQDLTNNNNLQSRIKRLIIRLNSSLNVLRSNDEESSSVNDSDSQQ